MPKDSFREIVQPEMVRIPGGSFLMGCDRGQAAEQPVHRVWVDVFAISAIQVTVQEFARFLDSTGDVAPPFWADPNFNHPEQPVVAVSWFQAVRYCEWLTAETSLPYRLPTEAEWEKAARGGREGLLFPWGDEPPPTLPHYAERWKTGPELVRRSPANGYGLFEMCENVHEWCRDWFDPEYYQVSPERNPVGPGDGSRRASRGGSWRHHIKISRTSARSSIPPEFQYADYGFRLACSCS